MIKTADSNLIFSECLLYHFIFQAFNKKGLLSHVTLLNRVQGRFFPRFFSSQIISDNHNTTTIKTTEYKLSKIFNQKCESNP